MARREHTCALCLAGLICAQVDGTRHVGHGTHQYTKPSRWCTKHDIPCAISQPPGRDEAYKDMDVTCFVAVVEDLEGTEATITATSSSNSSTGAMDGALAALRQGLDPLLQLPAGPSGPGRLVVGSLDVNVGHTLPSEELIGRLPQVCAPRWGPGQPALRCGALFAHLHGGDTLVG